jgi:hypothetical protein
MKKQILALLGILLTVVSVTPNSVYATANPPKQVVVAKIQAAFPDAPIMVAVADCESGLLHYDNGLPRKNEKGRHKVHKTVPKMIFICLYVAIKHQLLNFMIKKTSEMSIL